jgi:hypothetical protein
MPLSTEFGGNYGTESDDTPASEYCKFCYENGAFRNPDQTVDEMVQSSIDFMTAEFKMPEEQASQMSNDFIRKLKRWN